MISNGARFVTTLLRPLTPRWSVDNLDSLSMFFVFYDIFPLPLVVWYRSPLKSTCCCLACCLTLKVKSEKAGQVGPESVWCDLMGCHIWYLRDDTSAVAAARSRLLWEDSARGLFVDEHTPKALTIRRKYCCHQFIWSDYVTRLARASWLPRCFLINVSAPTDILLSLNFNLKMRLWC